MTNVEDNGHYENGCQVHFLTQVVSKFRGQTLSENVCLGYSIDAAEHARQIERFDDYKKEFEARWGAE
jgi:hypothetical protein